MYLKIEHCSSNLRTGFNIFILTKHSLFHILTLFAHLRSIEIRFRFEYMYDVPSTCLLVHAQIEKGKRVIESWVYQNSFHAFSVLIKVLAMRGRDTPTHIHVHTFAQHFEAVK